LPSDGPPGICELGNAAAASHTTPRITRQIDCGFAVVAAGEDAREQGSEKRGVEGGGRDVG